MSFVTTQPEALAAAAANLQGIGTTMNAQNAAAAAPTTGVVPAAADEVSALTAAQFAAHAQMYQTVSAQAAAIHEMFVNTLVASSGSYAPPRRPTQPLPAERARTNLLKERGNIRSSRVRGCASAQPIQLSASITADDLGIQY